MSCLTRQHHLPPVTQTRHDHQQRSLVLLQASLHVNPIGPQIDRLDLSTGPLGGLNNKAKVLKRHAYGFRDLEYFRLRLALLHKGTPAFPG